MLYTLSAIFLYETGINVLISIMDADGLVL